MDDVNYLRIFTLLKSTCIVTVYVVNHNVERVLGRLCNGTLLCIHKWSYHVTCLLLLCGHCFMLYMHKSFPFSFLSFHQIAHYASANTMVKQPSLSSPIHYISIGHFCPCAYALKANGLRDASYPFDWIPAEPQTVQKCIEDGFKSFLDRSQYYHDNNESCTDIVNKAQCHHASYGRYFFRHHCPKCFEEHFQYYERCVQRFKSIINDPTKEIVFVWLSIHDEGSEDQVDDLIQKGILEAFAETCIEHVKAKWHIAVLDCYENSTHRKAMIFSKPCDVIEVGRPFFLSGHTWVKIYCESKNTGVKFAHTSDSAMIAQVLKWFTYIRNDHHDCQGGATTTTLDDHTLKNVWPFALSRPTKKPWWTRCCLCA